MIGAIEAFATIGSKTIKKSQLTAFNFYRAILRVQRVIMQIHHTCKCCSESHAVGDCAVASQTHQFIAFGDIM